MAERLVVAITGASGVIYGIRLLQVLKDVPNVETHLVLSAAAKQTIAAETDWTIKDVEQLAHTTYDNRQVGAAIASGSFATRGMVVIPCSVKSLSAIANSYAADLVTRAADVALKEGRPLLLVVRETPLHLGHLRLMERAAETGAIIFPPVPAFYGKPQTLDEIIDGTVGRVLLRLGFENTLFTRWHGPQSRGAAPLRPYADFLAAQTTLTLATTNGDGSPHTCDLFYARDDVRGDDARGAESPFYFLSDPATRHIENLVREPRISATIHGAVRGWQEIRGVQVVGQATRADDAAERARAFDVYLAKYPFVRQWLPTVDALGNKHPQFGVVELYKLTPRWLRWIDNAQGFGHKQEWGIENSD